MLTTPSAKSPVTNYHTGSPTCVKTYQAGKGRTFFSFYLTDMNYFSARLFYDYHKTIQKSSSANIDLS